jgi:DNA-binding CsgD family transcriptional regulator
LSREVRSWLDPDVILREEDVCDMVRLIGEVVAVPGNHAEKKRFLMDGLCKLIGADAWAWALSCQRDPNKPQVYASVLNGGLTEDNLVKLLQAIDHPEMVEITGKFFSEVEEKRAHLTRLRFQITDKNKFNQSNANLAWKVADLGPVIMSLRPLDERSSSAIAIYRRYRREEFTVREARIAHIILTEVPWLHEQGWPEDRGVNVPKLSKRQRLTLNLLILGRTRKQMASTMDISVHTAQGYIKDVYRHFHVNSQGELMSRFLQGNGQDMR